jgi:hypothetical protein
LGVSSVALILFYESIGGCKVYSITTLRLGEI